MFLDRAVVGTRFTLNNFQMNLGAPRSGTSIHFHYTTLNAALYGSKLWLLFPPADSFYSTSHAYNWYKKHSHHPKMLKCVQRGGDILFLPDLWAHGVVYQSESVAVAYLYTGGLA